MPEKITLSVNNTIYPVLTLQGEEKLFTPYSFELILNIENLSPSHYFLNQPALLKISDIYQRERTISGVIIKVIQEDAGVTVQFTSRLSLLHYLKKPKTFVNQSIEAIARSILEEAGYHPIQIRWEQMNLETLSFRIQTPDQTDFEFLHQLLEEERVYYFFHCECDIEFIYFLKKPLFLFKREESLSLIYLQKSIK
jgi:uncharacterized protein involved in type VI secretion and phage assembly